MTVSWKAPVAVLVVVLGFAGVLVWQAWDWLDRYSGVKSLEGKDFVVAKLDAVKIALSVVAGGGALFALHLGVLRQRTADQDLRDRRAAQEHTELDANARRVTELYTKAADQLGSEKAAVRLAGLYALERLAHDNPGQRRTIVAVLCAYLRMPFDRPVQAEINLLEGDPPRSEHSDAILQQRKKFDEQAQEREVRQTAQRILLTHLRPNTDDAGRPQNSDYWPEEFDLDLTGAVLLDFDLSGCVLSSALFRRTSFVGETDFSGVKITGDAVFNEARFFSDAAPPRANFRGARLLGVTQFLMVSFGWDADFRGAEFGATADLDRTYFHGDAAFHGATFKQAAHFNSCTFDDDAGFEQARFASGAAFCEVTFSAAATFAKATFSGPVDLVGAQVVWSQQADPPDCDWPDGWKVGPLEREDDTDTWRGRLMPTK